MNSASSIPVLPSANPSGFQRELALELDKTGASQAYDDLRGPGETSAEKRGPENPSTTATAIAVSLYDALTEAAISDSSEPVSLREWQTRLLRNACQESRSFLAAALRSGASIKQIVQSLVRDVHTSFRKQGSIAHFRQGSSEAVKYVVNRTEGRQVGGIQVASTADGTKIEVHSLPTETDPMLA